MNTETFPIDLNKLEPLKLDPLVSALADAQKTTLRHNIQLRRDVIVFFTALAGARGLSGHTGGAYDTMREVMIIRAFIANGAPIVPIFYDEAGHRVATQYLLSVLNGAMPAAKLLHYRGIGQVGRTIRPYVSTALGAVNGVRKVRTELPTSDDG